MTIPGKKRRPGRPRSNPHARSEQLRLAKRAQRERDRHAGYILAQLKLSRPLAERLRRALAIPGFEDQLAAFLDEAVIDVERYPALKVLCWSRHDRFVTAQDALKLYERNWRFVDQKALDEHERRLIERLAAQHGNGVLNV